MIRAICDRNPSFPLAEERVAAVALMLFVTQEIILYSIPAFLCFLRTVQAPFRPSLLPL